MVAFRVVPAFAVGASVPSTFIPVTSVSPMAAHVAPCTTTAKVVVAPAAPSKLYIHEAAPLLRRRPP
jgi:hypothetical protein